MTVRLRPGDAGLFAVCGLLVPTCDQPSTPEGFQEIPPSLTSTVGAVLTQHIDGARSGSNTQETSLARSIVTAHDFGVIYRRVGAGGERRRAVPEPGRHQRGRHGSRAGLAAGPRSFPCDAGPTTDLCARRSEATPAASVCQEVVALHLDDAGAPPGCSARPVASCPPASVAGAH